MLLVFLHFFSVRCICHCTANVPRLFFAVPSEKTKTTNYSSSGVHTDTLSGFSLSFDACLRQGVDWSLPAEEQCLPSRREHRFLMTGSQQKQIELNKFTSRFAYTIIWCNPCRRWRLKLPLLNSIFEFAVIICNASCISALLQCAMHLSLYS